MFVKWNFTPGLMPPKFTEVRPMIGMGPRMIALVTAQELAANLGDDDGLRGWRDRCIEEIERPFVKPDIQCVMETVAPDGSIVDHFDGRTLNPGHAIEGACFEHGAALSPEVEAGVIEAARMMEAELKH